jgi:hypothetical protein
MALRLGLSSKEGCYRHGRFGSELSCYGYLKIAGWYILWGLVLDIAL